MSVAFVANVGSRDVQVDGRANLPRDARTMGETILTDWETYKHNLRLPILVKALESVLKKHHMLDRIVLFASDQNDPRYRHTDTMPFARIVKQYLIDAYDTDDHQWVEDAVMIVPIESNPSDYDIMMEFYGHAMKSLSDSDRVYLEVTGGTPAMSFMLLWRGVEILQQRAQPIYVIQERAMPLTLNIGQTLVVNALKNDLMDSINVYQYQAALKLLQTHKSVLQGIWRYYDAIEGVIEYARQRMNFNFELAEQALFGIDRGLSVELRTKMDDIVLEMDSRDNFWLLRDEIYGAEIDFRNRAYKDALANVFAFREGYLRQLAIKVGTILIDNKKLDPDWLNSNPDLVKYLKSKNIDINRNVTTFVFERILSFHAKSNPKIKTLTDKVDGFTELATVRNNAIHNHKGVSLAMIEEAYGDIPEQIILDLGTLYESLTGAIPTANPFDKANQLLHNLIGE